MCQAGQPVIRLEVIVDNDAAMKLGCNGATRCRHAIMRQHQRRGSMQPRRFAADAKTGFVQLPHWGMLHQRRDLLHHRLQCFSFRRTPGGDAGRTPKPRAEQVAHRCRHPIFRNQLLHVQIYRRRFDPCSILHRRAHACGKRRFRYAVTPCTAVDLRLILGDFQPQLRQLKYLSLLDPACHRRRQWRATMLAAGRRVPLDEVGLLRAPQGVAPMPNLSATLLVSNPAQTSRHPRRLTQPVARRRLAAVVAVLPQLPPKVGDFLLQGGVFLLQPGNFLL